MDAANNPKPITDAERIDRLRLIRSDNVGPRGVVAQTPPGRGHDPGRLSTTDAFKGCRP